MAVFLWFLLLDSLAGAPLRTPNLLGQAIVHGNAYAVAGLDFISQAIRQPTLLFALLMAFVMFEVVFVGVAYLVVRGIGADGLSWWSLVLGNLVAILAMGIYLKRHHRIINRWLARVPLGDTGDEHEVTTPEAWHAMGRWRRPLVGAHGRGWFKGSK